MFLCHHWHPALLVSALSLPCGMLLVLQFAQRTRTIELGHAKKMIHFRNMEEMLNKTKHDLATTIAQKEALQQAVNEAAEGRKRAEERVHTLSTDARKHYDQREGVLQEEKRMLKAQLDDTAQKLKAEKALRQVRLRQALLFRRGGDPSCAHACVCVCGRCRVCGVVVVITGLGEGGRVRVGFLFDAL